MQPLPRRLAVCWTVVAAAGLTACSTGCQVSVNGQTLPSPYYLKDDVQYYPPGPEFKLSREAAAQKAYREEVEQRRAPVR